MPDVGATAIAITNNDQELANRIAADMSEYMWRIREEFASGQFPMPSDAVRLARQAIAREETPVAMGDYSDRSGDATFILQALIDQGVSKFLYASLRDERALETLEQNNAQPGDPFAMDVGGFAGPASGDPVHIEGTVAYRGAQLGYEHIAAIAFGDDNMLILTPTYEQVIFPEPLRFGPIDPDDYDVIVVKSRAHFRRGFDETGYAKSIFVVDAPGAFVGTTRLNALDYEFAPINELYPFGTPPGRQ